MLVEMMGGELSSGLSSGKVGMVVVRSTWKPWRAWKKVGEERG